LDELKDAVTEALDLSFILHDSSFRCGDYWRYTAPDGTLVVVQDNCLEGPDEHHEPDFPDHRVLLYVEAELDEAPLASIPGLDLLREAL
jgi:hypothetical protein